MPIIDTETEKKPVAFHWWIIDTDSLYVFLSVLDEWHTILQLLKKVIYCYQDESYLSTVNSLTQHKNIILENKISPPSLNIKNEQSLLNLSHFQYL